jgi:hypothetical protein
VVTRDARGHALRLRPRTEPAGRRDRSPGVVDGRLLHDSGRGGETRARAHGARKARTLLAICERAEEDSRLAESLGREIRFAIVDALLDAGVELPALTGDWAEHAKKDSP